MDDGEGGGPVYVSPGVWTLPAPILLVSPHLSSLPLTDDGGLLDVRAALQAARRRPQLRARGARDAALHPGAAGLGWLMGGRKSGARGLPRLVDTRGGMGRASSGDCLLTDPSPPQPSNGSASPRPRTASCSATPTRACLMRWAATTTRPPPWGARCSSSRRQGSLVEGGEGQAGAATGLWAPRCDSQGCSLAV